MPRLARKNLKFIGWCVSSLFLSFGLVNPTKFICIAYIALWLTFLPPLYSQLTNRYGLKRNIVGRIIILFLSLSLLSFSQPESQQASKPQATSTQIVIQTPKAKTPKPIFVSSEYKMFRSAGASPEKAQALKDACTTDKTCPTTLKIAKAVVRGEITLGLVSKPDQPCTETEFKKDDVDFCYYKSAEGRKSIREAEAANKTQENNSSGNDISTESISSTSLAREEHQKQAVLAAAQKFVDEADTPEKVEALGENCRIMIESGTAKEKALCIGIASIYAGQ
jgi:hypothetical protein